MGLVTKLQTNTVIQPSISFILKSAVLPIESNQWRTLKSFKWQSEIGRTPPTGKGATETESAA